MARETPCSTLVQCLIFLLMIETLLLVASAVVFMVLLIPHSPNFQVVSFNTSPMVLTPVPLKPNSAILSATWNLTFVARNPNQRQQLHYTDVEVSIYYKWLCLSYKKLEFFKQTEGTEVVSHVSISNSTVLSNRNAATMHELGGASQDRAIDFIVKFRGTVGVYVGTSMPTKHALSIDCDGVRVVFSHQNGTGTMLGPPRKCYRSKFIF